MTTTDPPFELPSGTRLGRVALSVNSLDDVLPFYRGVGFEVERTRQGARLLTADGTELLSLVEDPDAPERPETAAGLFHVAVRFPTREGLADAFARLQAAGLALTGASDHLVSEALYLRDPEGNGVELYWDKPRDEWPRSEDGRIKLDSLPLDLDTLAGSARQDEELPAGTAVGHVHLEVADLARARDFYTDTLGFRLQAPTHRDRATFVAAGDYHHHVGLNTWGGRTDPAGEARGLDWYELVVPDSATAETLRERTDAVRTDDGVATTDPDGIEIRLTVA